MSSIELTVTPEELRKEADRMQQSCRNILKLAEGAQTTIRDLMIYWQGEAASLHEQQAIQEFQKLSADVNQLQKRVQNLMLMAGIYEETEREASALAELLNVSELDI